MQLRCFLCKIPAHAVTQADDQGREWFVCPHCGVTNRLARTGSASADNPQGYEVVGIDFGGRRPR